MSIWIHILCRRTVGSLQPSQLAQGIERRLGVLAYLFLPEEEEEPEAVLARLRLEADPGPELRRLRIHYRAQPSLPLKVDRWSDPPAVAEEVRELLAKLEGHSGPAATDLRERLRATIESVAIELKASHARDMGWPLAICAAAELAERGDGVIRAEGRGFMLPSGNEVDIVLPQP
jgi:hypothetical protein